MKAFRLLTKAALIVGSALVAGPVAAQTIGTGTIDGRVVDETGGVLPGVTVDLTNTQTGLSRTVVTEGTGVFRAPLLPVGAYSVIAQLTSFKTYQRDGVLVSVGSAVSLGDIVLEVATVEETITVTAASPVIETSRSVVANTFDARAVENLPIEGRDYKDFALLTPTVVRVQNNGRRTLSMGGMKGADTNITLDGADFNNTFFGSATGQPEVPFFVVSQEAVQEFQVLANGYSAEFGRSGGGFLNVVTKSGTNDIHGSGFFFGRAEGLRSTLQDADGSDLTNSEFGQNQYGASFGGPVIKDKAHFFLSVDRQKFDQPINIRFRRDVSGVSNQALFGANIAGFDNLSDAEGDTAQLLSNNAFLAKLDFQVTDNNTLSVRYNFSDFTGENFFSAAGGVVGPIQDTAANGTNLEQNTAHSLVVNNTTVIGNNKFNELRFQYSFEERPRLGQSDDVPSLEIQDTGNFGRRFFLPITSDHSRIQLTNNFTYLFGGHDLKVGTDINLTETSQAFFGWGGGQYRFTTLEDYVAGNPNRFIQRLGLNGFSTRDSGTQTIDQKELAFYVQDTWRPKPGLTLNLGLRWEGSWNPTPGQVDPTTGLQSANPANPGLDSIGLQQTEIPNDLNNFAPRLGFAWDPNNDGRTVVRGGGGLFYSRVPLLLMANVTTGNGYRQALFFLFGDDIPAFPFAYPDAGLPPEDPLNASLPTSSIAFFDPDFQNPRTARFNMGVERQVTDTISIGTDFVYADTSHGHRRLNLNLAPPTGQVDEVGRSIYDGGVIDSEYGEFQVESSGARREYLAWVINAKKQFADDFQFQAFYTLSNTKTDDDNERDSSGFQNTQPNNLGADWADSDLDTRHRFVANGVFNVPGGINIGALISASSGVPFNVVSGDDDNGDNNNNDRPVVTSTLQSFAAGAGQDLPLGLLERNAGRQPANYTVDVRVSKLFDFDERANVEFLFEIFNLFNNANRFTSNGNINSSNFGFLNAIGSPRQIQLGARVRW